MRQCIPQYTGYNWPIQENHRQEDHLVEGNYPFTYIHQTETCQCYLI